MVNPCVDCDKPVRRHKEAAAEPLCRPCQRKRKLARAEEKALRGAIDWAAVEWVVQGDCLRLTPAEMRMVVRRLDEKLINLGESMQDIPPGRLTSKDLAQRMRTTSTNVIAIRARLDPAEKSKCPVCRDVMWVLGTGVVEEHPDGFLQPCVMSNRFAESPVFLRPTPEGLLSPRLRGLARIRPELYGWAS